jgi:segregation and condensation protein A
MSQDYRVRLAAFEGPLDLLLYLIRRAEVEITDIPIAALTTQYLSYLGDLDDRRIDIDTAGEFLVMAATLMEIKSRQIARGAEEPAATRSSADATDPVDDWQDPRAELVRQLLEYKKYRDLADGLESRRETWLARYPASAAAVDRENLLAAIEDLDGLESDEFDLGELIAAFGRIAASVNLARIGDHEVIADDTPIELFAADIVDRLQHAAQPLTLRHLLTGRTRAEMVGLFLGVLDLIRQQRIGVRQIESAEFDGDRFELFTRSDADSDQAVESDALSPHSDAV